MRQRFTAYIDPSIVAEHRATIAAMRCPNELYRFAHEHNLPRGHRWEVLPGDAQAHGSSTVRDLMARGYHTHPLELSPRPRAD